MRKLTPTGPGSFTSPATFLTRASHAGPPPCATIRVPTVADGPGPDWASAAGIAAARATANTRLERRTFITAISRVNGRKPGEADVPLPAYVVSPGIRLRVEEIVGA